MYPPKALHHQFEPSSFSNNSKKYSQQCCRPFPVLSIISIVNFNLDFLHFHCSNSVLFALLVSALVVDKSKFFDKLRRLVSISDSFVIAE